MTRPVQVGGSPGDEEGGPVTRPVQVGGGPVDEGGAL